MPCVLNSFLERFDFGVSLEDVFPPEDLHPRLKYLFHLAYKAYLEQNQSIAALLEYHQGPLHERLELKDRLVFASDYYVNVKDFSPGTYFWVIRHFLGLLPIPLLPTYTNGVNFDWRRLTDDVKNFFKCQSLKERNILEYVIAQELSMLPVHNLILLNVLIQFIRMLSIKRMKRYYLRNSRISLKVVSQYFCSSLFVRPFRPQGHEKCGYFPLFIFLVTRWKSIYQHCCTIGLNPVNFQDSQICSEKVQSCLLFQAYSKCWNKDTRDSNCQTDSNLSANASFSSSKSNNPSTKPSADVYKLAFIEEVDEESTCINEELDSSATFYQTAPEFQFTDLTAHDECKDWTSIMMETNNVVQKIEESYIYDDYETFKKEDFNQIGAKKSLGSLLSKISKCSSRGSSKNSSMENIINNCSTPKKYSPESDNSYVKYPDVCNESGMDSCSVGFPCYLDDKNRDFEELKINDHAKSCEYTTIGRKLFSNGSPVSFSENEDSKEGFPKNSEKKYRRKGVVSRLRITLEFLRNLTLKHGTLRKIETTVRYERIGNQRSQSN